MNTRAAQLGQKLKKLREQKGFSQRDLAGLCEASEGTVHHWENGKGMATLCRLLKALKALGVDARHFVET